MSSVLIAGNGSLSLNKKNIGAPSKPLISNILSYSEFG
jgi:hypothetical protein